MHGLPRDDLPLSSCFFLVQIKAYHNFEAIHQLSVADPNFHSTFDQETWEGLAEAFIRNEDLDNFCSEWSPRHGNVKERLKWKNKRKPGAAQVRQSEQPSPLRSRSQTGKGRRDGS